MNSFDFLPRLGLRNTVSLLAMACGSGMMAGGGFAEALSGPVCFESSTPAYPQMAGQSHESGPSLPEGSSADLEDISYKPEQIGNNCHERTQVFSAPAGDPGAVYFAGEQRNGFGGEGASLGFTAPGASPFANAAAGGGNGGGALGSSNVFTINESTSEVPSFSEVDTIIISADYSSALSGSESADTVQVTNGAAMSGLIDLKGGDDTVAIDFGASANQVSFSSGNNVLKGSGTVTGRIHSVGSLTIGNFSDDAPSTDNALVLNGPISLMSAAGIKALEIKGAISSESTVHLDVGGSIAGVSAGAGSNRIVAGNVGGNLDFTGGVDPGQVKERNSEYETVVKVKDMSGDLILTGGTNLIEADNVWGEISTGDGDDTVSLRRGTSDNDLGELGDIDLGNGVNSLTIEGGSWKGTYVGGSGVDTVTIASAASASGDWNLGGGNNIVRIAGRVSGSIFLGDGNDVVGGLEHGSFAHGIGHANNLWSLDLGDGDNIARVFNTTEILAGDGDDSIYLSLNIPLRLSKIDLGSGTNRFWVVGNGDSLAGLIPLSGNLREKADESPNDFLYLCRGTFTEEGCGPAPNEYSHFNVGLDASGGNIWETIKISNPRSSLSHNYLQVHGRVTLLDPEFNNLTMIADHNTGDVITVTGTYEILSGGRTLFELDADLQNGVYHSDMLRFENAKTAVLTDQPDGFSLSSVATVNVNMIRSLYAAPPGRLNLVTVDSKSDISDVVIEGMSDGEINLNGQTWRFGKSSENGLTTYFLENSNPILDPEQLIIKGTGDTAGDVEVPESVNQVKVVGDWSGNYTGLPGDDNITVISGVTASGESWKLFGGDNVLKGSGTISASVVMGDGDDTIGDFTIGWKEYYVYPYITHPRVKYWKDSNIIFEGPIDLGDGTNRVKASSAASITGGSGSDTIMLTGDAFGTIDLGGGTTANYLAARSIWGDVTSTAAGPPGVWDTVYIEGGHGSVDLGDGGNKLKLCGSWGGNYYGGSGPDIITSCSWSDYFWGTELDLGDGDDSIKGTNWFSGKVSLGDGNDVVGTDPGGRDGDVLTTEDNPSKATLAEDNMLGFGRLDLGSGDNMVWARRAWSITAGDGADSVVMSWDVIGSVHLGGGPNRLEAANLGAGFTGGDSEDRVIVSGDLAGRVDLGGGASDNTLSVGGTLGGAVSSSATGRDEVSIHKGYGNIDLGGGVNDLTLSGGEWTGEYKGGDGPDTIKVNGGSASGDWDLGGGDNAIHASGWLSGSIELGDGNDMVGNGLLYPALERINLGGGDNHLQARAAGSISAGPGDDSVYLKPDSEFTLSSLDLGGGENSLWILGGEGAAEGRRVTVSLPGDGVGLNRLYLCNEAAAAAGCGFAGAEGHAFNAVLDATSQGQAWEPVKVGAKPSAFRSKLSVRGSVTLQDPELNDFMLAGDGAAGDMVTVTGAYEMLEATSSRGTLFELDVSTGAFIAADALRFEGASAVSGQSSDGRNFTTAPSILLMAGGDVSEPKAGSRLEIATVDSTSDISGVSIVAAGSGSAVASVSASGQVSGGQIVLNGHSWNLMSESSAGATIYYLRYGEEIGIDRLVITGVGDTAGDVDLGGGGNYVTVVGDWSGSYTGLHGIDDMTVNANVTASGREWSLGGGDNALRGSGVILARVVMGDGDDTIGGFGAGSEAEDSLLVFEGPVELGGGTNRMKAAGAAAITGGSGPDTISLSGDASGDIDLGGGQAVNSLAVGGLLEGNVTSAATGTPGSRDMVVIAGGSGSVDLGGGGNELTVNGAWSGSYSGGSGYDAIIACSCATLSGSRLDLGGGNDVIRGSASISAAVSLGEGNDVVGANPGGPDGDVLTASDNPHDAVLEDENGLRFSGALDLGGGRNMVWAASATSITGGSGADSVFISGAVSGSVDLGGGPNRLEAASLGAGFTGGDSEDRVIVSGDLTGRVDLRGGASDNTLSVGGALGGAVSSSATGRDEVSIHGGVGGVALGGGENALALLGGDWSGTYEGGPGPDLVTVASGARGSGLEWNLGGGANEIRGSGSVSANITLGGGDDVIGGLPPGFSLQGGKWLQSGGGWLVLSGSVALGGGTNIVRATSAESLTGGDGADTVTLTAAAVRIDLGGGENRLEALFVDSYAGGSGPDTVTLGVGAAGHINLGGGDNHLHARLAKSISAGSGNDSVYLKPDLEFALSSLDLGGGENSLWILGREGAAEARRVTISSPGLGSGVNRLYLCNEGASPAGCGSSGAGGHAFDAVIDATLGGEWDSIKLGAKPSEFQSRLSVRGSVTLRDPELNDLMLAGDGAAGDAVTVAGSYQMLAPAPGRGTLFELDVRTGAAAAADILRFEGATAASGQSSDGRDFATAPSIALRAMGDPSEPEAGSRLEIVTVDSASDISGVSIVAADSGASLASALASGNVSGGEIVLNGHPWSFSRESFGGKTTYYLLYGLGEGIDRLVITGTGETAGDVDLGGGLNYVTVAGDWSGNYTGLDGVDDMTVNSGVVASGREWRLGAGDNALRGSGAVSARIVMGGGDDTVGGFGPDAPASDSALALSGPLELGDGANRVRAASASSITGGRDSDSITLTGAASGHVDLGEGTNSLRASGVASVSGGSGADTIVVTGEVSGDISLGGGEAGNTLEAGALVEADVTSSATGPDNISLGGGSGDIRLGGGFNQVYLLSGSAWSGAYEGGGGADVIWGTWAWTSGDWDLGSGGNTLHFSGTHSGSITFGDGDDSVSGAPVLIGGFSPVLDRVHLGGGENSLSARVARSISGGAGPDSVRLSPDRDFSLSLDLGGGSNSLWVLGDDGALPDWLDLYPEYLRYDFGDGTRRVTVPLSGVGSSSSLNRLYLCNWTYAKDGCDSLDPGDETARNFNVALEGTGGGSRGWDSIKVGVEPSPVRSLLSIRGSVTLEDPEFNDFMLVGNGTPGDAVTVTGSYEILAPDSNLGTLFELDVETAAAASDILRFEGARSASGQQTGGRGFVSVPSVALRVSGGGEPANGSRVDIVTVDSASDISGVSVAGADPDGGIVLDGHSWSLSSERSGNATVYYLIYSVDPADIPEEPDDGVDRLTITGVEGDVDLGGGSNFVTVVGDWSGNYTGLEGVDDMTVISGVTASGSEWRLGDGDNALRGSGTILAKVFMGDGDDTVGDFGPAASAAGLALSGGIELGGGANRVRAASAGAITGGGGSDSITLSGAATGHIDLGDGANSLAASSAASITGGSGPDTFAISGDVSGAVSLGGGETDNTLEAGGLLDGDVTSAATGRDSVSLGGGAGDIRLGGGINEVALSGGEWSGEYEGGDGPDTIRVYGASASGAWNLGHGDNAILASGWLSGPIALGDGNDTVGSGLLYPALGMISLGGGDNRLQARVAKSIEGGLGLDRIYLKPDLEFALSSVDLGGGENSLWILGREGGAEGRGVTIPLSSASGSGLNRLYLCNEAPEAGGCGTLVETGHAFHATLDASGGNAWDTIKVGVEPSPFQSRLSVRGSVTLADPEFNDFMLVANGAPGDEVTVTGSYEILAAGFETGTLFELDVITGSHVASDTLRFEGASAASGLSSDGREFALAPSIALRVSGDGTEPKAESRVEIVTIVNSDVEGVSVDGLTDEGSIVLDGHAWSLGSEASGGGTVFFLSYAPAAPGPVEPPVDPGDGIDRLVITGTGATAGDVDLGGGVNYVTVVGDWSGNYAGLGDLDDMTVEGGVTASGTEWRLGGGDNNLRGSGTILARVYMEDGADTIGGFGPGARRSDNSLVLSGGAELGNGANRVRAVSAGSIIGGRDSDWIELSGAAAGHVDLGDGTNTLKASGAASFTGGSGQDTVILSGDAIGEINLGGGENRLEAIGAAAVTGLSGSDTVILEAGASGLVSLGDGSNRVEALSVGSFSGGADDDTLILLEGSSGHVELGGGANRLEASGVNSVSGGSGPDIVNVDGTAAGAIKLGSGASDNSLSVSGTIGGDVTSSATGRDEVAIGGGTGGMRLGDGENLLSLKSGAWSGAYEGGSGPDSISIASGASASGNWRLGGGADSVQGAGEVSGEIDMGAGDDTIGDFAQGAPASASSLALSGHLILGDGENRVRAASAAEITGGAGPDTVILAERASGHVDLGDGANWLEAAGVSAYAGGSGADTVIVDGDAAGAISLGAGSNSLTVKGTIGGKVTSGPTGRDDVSIGGGTGDINLAGGSNTLRLASGAWLGTYDGGSDPDTILVDDGASASGDWKLEGGKDTLRGTGEISGEVDMGAGDDIIGNLAANAPSADSKLAFAGHLILGPGHDKVKAVSAKSIESTGGAEITLSGGISGAVNLAGGWNRVRAESAGSIAINGGAGDFSFRSGVGRVTLGDSEHPHLFEAKSVGEIVISCPGGGEGEGEAAEPCGESRITVGSVTGGISMTNHVSTFMSVNGTIGGNVSSVSSEGSDRIGFDGGDGDIDLGGGENHLALLHGVWSGRYTGGDGADTIRVRGPAKVTGDLHLGDGDNVLTGSGIISGEVHMGSGDDSAGGFLDTGAAAHLMSLSGIHLGGGDNTVVARRAEAITAGSGADRIVLFPESELEISELNLGGGDNELWISGASGEPGSRRITIPLNGDGDGSGGGDLHICGETVMRSGAGGLNCADLAGTDYGFNVALDAGDGNAWDFIQIDNQYNSHVSLLSVTGDVTIKDSRLGFMTVEGNGAAGDSLTVAGSYGIFPHHKGLGTVFELDVDTESLKSDTLRFESATRLDGDDFGSVAAVRINAVSSSSTAEEGSRIDLVTVDASSDVSGVGVQDLQSGKITLNGERWTVKKDNLEEGGSIYYLVISPDEATISGGSRNVDFGNGLNNLTVTGAWSGDYTGGSGIDTLTVSGGATLFGDLRFGGGDNVLRGTGSIHGSVFMGDGDDTVSNFGSAAASSGGGLKLLGHLDLGDGANRVTVASAAGITGGGGYDRVTLSGGSSGSIALGGGENHLETSGEVKSYSGGPGNDTVEIGEGGSVLDPMELGGGENVVSGSPSDDRVSLDGGTASVNLGGGENSLTALGAWRGSYEAGSGNDRFVSESRLSVLESASLGGGDDHVILAGRAEGAIDLGDGDNTVVLRGGARSSGEFPSLWRGAGRVFAEGLPAGDSGTTEVDLSRFEGRVDLMICAGQVDAGSEGCTRSAEGDSRFRVALAAEGESAGGFRARIENVDSSGQSLLLVSGDLTIHDSDFGNLRIASNGERGQRLTLAGVQAFAEDTVVALGVSSWDPDFLEIKSTVRGAEGAGAKGPIVALGAARGGGEGGSPTEIKIARIDASSDAELRFSETSIFLGDDIWHVMPARPDGEGGMEYYLAPEGIGIGERAAAAQQVLSTSGAIATSIATAAAQARPGFTGGAGPGVSQDGPGQSGASFWTRVTVSEETERLRIGQGASEFGQSMWVLNSGAELLTHRAPGGRLSHSLIAQYGSSSSKGEGGSGRGLESSLAGLGYSLLYRRDGGAYAQISAMSSEISGAAGGEEYSLGGSSVSAEAGMAFASGGRESMLTVSPLARMSFSKFGEVSLRSGDSSGIEKASGALGILADYETGGAGGGGSRSLYGGVTVTHDFQGGFGFVPKDRDGNRTVAIEVDSRKTWVTLEAGWAWSLGESGRAFMEASQASASGKEAGGERQSLTLGFDLSW